MGQRPPLSYLNRQGELAGLAVDLACQLNKAGGRKTEFYIGTIPELMEMLRHKRIDYICGVPMQEPMPAGFTFIPSSFILNRRILVANPDIAIASEEDFSGHAILIVEADQSYARIVQEYGGTVIMAENTPHALKKLSLGEANAFVTSLGEVASNIVQAMHMQNLSLKGMSLQRIAVGIIVSEDSNSAILASRLAGELTKMEADGELEKLREKWMGRPIMTEPGIWERYGNSLLYTVSATMALLLLFALWNIALRRRVRRVTHHLLESEQRYRNLTEASPDIVVLVDSDGELWFANRTARSYFCLMLEGDPPQRVLLDSLDNVGRQTLREIIASVMDGKVVWHEFYLRLGKRVLPVEFIVFHAAAEHQGQPLVCCIGRDMSQRRNMENELARAERLALIGRLAAEVAHEINNPLGIILANAEYLRKRVATPQLDAIIRNVERASLITCRLLHLAVERERENALFDLNEVVEESLAFLKPRLTLVKVELELASAMPAKGDRAQFEQLILNLLLNALDSMDNKGRLRIWSRFVPTNAESAGGLTLAVEDDGPGIAKDNLERIFEVFFTTKGKTGFGLGLFVARHIAELHGGLLWAESDQGHGTTMMLELPAAPST